MKLTDEQIIRAIGMALQNPKNHNRWYYFNSCTLDKACKYCPLGLIWLLTGSLNYCKAIFLYQEFGFSVNFWDTASESERLEFANKLANYRTASEPGGDLDASVTKA